MTALDVQKKMNTAYERRQYKKAFSLYLLLCDLRVKEGIEAITLPNLVLRAIELKLEVPTHIIELQGEKLKQLQSK